MSIPNEIVSISRYYGSHPGYVIAGGGNTSYKEGEKLWIKASGISLADIDESGFVCLSRIHLDKISGAVYSKDPSQREEQVKWDLKAAIIGDKRPSVETSLLNLFTLFVNNELTGLFVMGPEEFSKTAKPFTPDNIVYCKSEYLLTGGNAARVNSEIESFEIKYDFFPRIIGLEKAGLISTGINEQSAARSMEMFLDMMKISFLSENFSGPEFLKRKQIEFIDNWEAENYRRSI